MLLQTSLCRFLRGHTFPLLLNIILRVPLAGSFDKPMFNALRNCLFSESELDWFSHYFKHIETVTLI